MSPRPIVRSCGLGLVLVLALAASGCFSPLVGAECEQGRTACDGVCLDLSSDPANCGACGAVCDRVCTDGVCHGQPTCTNPDGCPIDAGTNLDAGPDASTNIDAGLDASVADAGTPDADLGCDIGDIECGGVCVNPLTDHDHCGTCPNRCAPDQFCAGGICTPVCDPPFDLCGQVCVDLQTDRNHCGACPTKCESGICQAGVCADLKPGHVILIGHDFTHPRQGMNRLVGNSAFLALGSPVKVLAYTGRATAAAIAGTDSAIDQVASETGRSWTKTVVTDAAGITLGLASTQVLLIYAQNRPGTTNASLLQLGTDISTALNTFLHVGGIVIVCDGGGTSLGTWQVLSAAGQFTGTGKTVVTADTLSLVSPFDAVGSNVPLTYNGEVTSVSFTSAQGNQVVRAPNNQPVVIHTIVF